MSGDLASLPRQQLQRRAKEAGIKANQSSEVLVQQLMCKQRCFGGQLTSSQANQPLSDRQTLKTLKGKSASTAPSPPLTSAPSSMRKRFSPNGLRFQMTFSPIVGHRLSTSGAVSSSTASSPAQQSYIEMNTIELTVAKLKSLGFGDEEAQWAAQEAKARQFDEDDALPQDFDLSLDMSMLCLETKQEDEDRKEEQLPLSGRALELVLGMLNTWDLCGLTMGVSKEWRNASLQVLRKVSGEDQSDCATNLYEGTRDLGLPMSVPPTAFTAKFPWGKFLAVGGFKQVFLVYNASEGRMEAISVMDLAAMADTDNVHVADTEIRIALLLSHLVKGSPHFVATFQTLRCDLAPPTHWGTEQNKEPNGSLDDFLVKGVGDPMALKGRGKRKLPPKGDFQYIRMEYCTEGDVEEALRRHPFAPAHVIEALFVQMAISLKVFHDLSMRHYDIKLLNFFLTRAGSDVGKGGLVSENQDEYWQRGGLVVKLADFGTADVDETTLNEPMDERQVTTWENVLPAFLLYGSDCKRDGASDMHGLALCFVHLLIGDRPYEEAVEALVCPPKLADKWKAVWTGKAKDRAQADEGGTVLEDTLYRNMVLFGADLVSKASEQRSSPVLDALRDFVKGQGRARWEEDVRSYALVGAAGGDTQIDCIARARKMLSQVRQGSKLLRGMSNIDGSSRMTFLQLVQMLTQI